MDPALYDICMYLFSIIQDDEIQSLKKSLEELKEQLVKEKTVPLPLHQHYPEEAHEVELLLSLCCRYE